MSDTPRTDAVEDMGDNFLQAVDSDFSRQLESELNAANEQIKELESELDSYRLWNWKLRETGEDMHYRLTMHASHEPVLKKWKDIKNGVE